MITTPVRLQRGAWRMDLLPELGGSVQGLWFGEAAVLRPTPEGATHAGQTAAFPLVPYSNRIGRKAFAWRGHRYTIDRAFDDGPHALHGVGFMRPWQVTAQSEDSISLSLVHDGDADWPFAFEAEQHFTLQEHGLGLRLSMRNTDQREQPAGLGWHPYFVRRAGARLRGEGLEIQWQSGADQLPTQGLPLNGLSGLVEDTPLDHCFRGGSRLGFSDDSMDLDLKASTDYWVLYTPSERDFFCIEPVSHLNNAVQQPDPQAHGLVALASGQSLVQAVELKVSWR